MKETINIPRLMSEAERVAHYARMLEARVVMPTMVPDWYARATEQERDTIPAPPPFEVES